MNSVNKCYLLTPLIKEEPQPKKFPSIRFYGTFDEAELTMENFITHIVDEKPELVFDLTGKVTLATVDEKYYALPEYDNIYKINREIEEYLTEINQTESKT